MSLTPEQIQAFRDKHNITTGQSPKNTNSSLSSEQIRGYRKRFNIPTPKEEGEKKEGAKGLKGLTTGFAKSAGNFVRGTGQLGEDFGNLFLPKKFEPKNSLFQPDSEAGSQVVKALERKGTSENVGGFIGDVAQFAIPGAKTTKALSFIPKVASRAFISGTVATAQEGNIGKETLIGAGSEVVLPGVSKAVKSVIASPTKRLMKSLASGVSGQSTEALESIFRQPKTSAAVTKAIKSGDERSIVQAQAQVILDGVKSVKKDAGKKFGEALEQLSKEDIDPIKIRNNTSKVLSANDVSTVGGKVSIGDGQIIDEKIQRKAISLVEEVNKQKDLTGSGVRRIMDFIESKKFTTVSGNADRGAFNKLADDLSGAFKKAVNESTDKLQNANKAFSEERNLVDGIEKIFGKVKFGKDVDLDNIARKVDGIFNKKGLDQFRIDDFLTKIGVEPDKFRSAQATRQLLTKGQPTNTPGGNISEFFRALTGAVVSPELIGSLSRATGRSEQVLTPILRELSPATRAVFVKSILDIGDDVSDEIK